MLARFTYLNGPRKGESTELDAEVISIGRAPDNLLCFGDNERRVSSHHAEARRKGDRYVLRDLGSTNGTMINGRRVIVSEILHDDLIEFGAGGPLVRFAIERNGNASAADRAGSRPVGATNPPEPQKKEENNSAWLFRSRKNNTWLIAALVVAMLIGAAGGILLSSRSQSPSYPFVAVAQRNSPAVVFIRSEHELVDGAGQVLSTEARTGSGFVMHPDGLIVTNRHLVRDWDYNQPPQGITGRTKKIEVVFPGQKPEAAIPAQVYRLAPTADTDIAILKINAPPEMPVAQGIGGEPPMVYQGDEVAIIGYPLGLDLFSLTNDTRVETSLSTGVVSRVSPEIIQLNLRAYQGNSGGPVLNRRGQIIGILTANVSNAQDLALCIPIETAVRLIENQ
ncbi:MAG TPA: trypsin-like peptidase domain-containing protein [Blastocatellia bacterium]|nr:trypsin-like peptidase domain-containing protein [Blastocatellia bacterium]